MAAFPATAHQSDGCLSLSVGIHKADKGDRRAVVTRQRHRLRRDKFRLESGDRKASFMATGLASQRRRCAEGSQLLAYAARRRISNSNPSRSPRASAWRNP